MGNETKNNEAADARIMNNLLDAVRRLVDDAEPFSGGAFLVPAKRISDIRVAMIMSKTVIQKPGLRKGTKVLSKTRKETGIATGGSRRCTLEGCNGLRIGVRWADGRITWPCSRGMIQISNGRWKII